MSVQWEYKYEITICDEFSQSSCVGKISKWLPVAVGTWFNEDTKLLNVKIKAYGFGFSVS